MDRTLTAFLTDDHRWEALQQRDRAADGAFFYAVKTTGVYCRPTCASRVPNRKNVAFFDTWSAAEQAGFRSCKRCQPKAETLPEIAAIKRACEIIEAAEAAPKLNALADAVGWSQYHFQRVFKRTVGVTPKDYFAAKRLRRLQDSLQQPSSVTEAIHEAGFGSISRVYEDTAGLLGMSPQTYKTGAVGVEIRFAVEESFIGWVLVAASDRGICAIELGETAELLTQRLQERFPNANLQQNDREFATWVSQVVAFIDAPQRGLDLPLDIQGTAFQQQVWKALQAIPVGTTASYTEIATRIGQPKAVRAVAQACASNRIAVAIPCHRVVRSDGKLSGYRWGIDRKRALLDREAISP